MKFLTAISQILTPKHQQDRVSWCVSLLLAASVLLSVFAPTATGRIATQYVPVRDPNAEVAPIVTDIALATAIRKELNITDKSQALTVANLESLTDLDGFKHGISSLAGLEHATNLEYLYLIGNAISDLTPLKGLTKLRRIRIGANQISDLTPLKGLTKLTELSIGYNRISDLTPLTGMTQLGSLNLNGHQISDLTPLKGLTELSSLNLSNNRISDLTPLKSLTELYDLDLDNNKIRDISPLAGLSDLEILDLSNNYIANIEPIKPLIENAFVFDLYIGGNALSATDIAYLRAEEAREDKILGLTVWGLHSGNVEEGQSPEAEIPNDTLRAKLQELEGISEDAKPTHKFLSTLTSLDLSGKDIGNFTGLESAINLTSLTLNNAKMTNKRLSKLAEILAELPKLTELYLGHNKITNVSALAGLTQLTKLDLSQNNITDVSDLKSLTSLTDLDLEDNSIGSIEGLSPLTGLQRLNLNANHRLTDVTPLAGLTQLTHLSLSRNRIVDVTPLAGLTQLQTLTLDRNRIADFDPIASLTATVTKEAQKADPVVKIPDANLRSAVLTALGRSSTDEDPISSSEMATLTTLTAQNAGISDLTGLQRAVNLKTLDLSGNALDDDDVQRLLKLTQLETLDLSGNDNITNPKPFKQLKNLTDLRLPEDISTEDPIVSIPDRGLRSAILRALGKSESDDTQITESDMHDLRALQASGYGISDLTGLEHATNLGQLYLNDNKISDLSPIRKLARLGRLSLNNNNISDVEPLKDLERLRWLRLNDNRISSVASLDGLSKLKTLTLGNNRLSDVSPLEALPLEELYLDGNPIDMDRLSTKLKALVEPESVQAAVFNLLDVNRDGKVNQDDVDIVSRFMGIPSGDLVGVEKVAAVYPDVDNDGDVDQTDVDAVVAAATEDRGEGETSPETDPGSVGQ